MLFLEMREEISLWTESTHIMMFVINKMTNFIYATMKWECFSLNDIHLLYRYVLSEISLSNLLVTISVIHELALCERFSVQRSNCCTFYLHCRSGNNRKIGRSGMNFLTTCWIDFFLPLWILWIAYLPRITYKRGSVLPKSNQVIESLRRTKKSDCEQW